MAKLCLALVALVLLTAAAAAVVVVAQAADGTTPPAEGAAGTVEAAVGADGAAQNASTAPADGQQNGNATKPIAINTKIRECGPCVSQGYGWCPIRRKCGGFQNKVCSGTYTDIGTGVVQEVSDGIFEAKVYDASKPVFILFHASMKKADKQLFVDAVDKLDEQQIDRAVFAAIDVTKWRKTAAQLKITPAHIPALVLLPTAVAGAVVPFNSPARAMVRFERGATLSVTDYAKFIAENIHVVAARIPELDELVRPFVDAIVVNNTVRIAELLGNASEIVTKQPTANATAAAELQKLILESDGHGFVLQVQGFDMLYLALMHCMKQYGIGAISRAFNDLKELNAKDDRLQIVKVFVEALLD